MEAPVALTVVTEVGRRTNWKSGAAGSPIEIRPSHRTRTSVTRMGTRAVFLYENLSKITRVCRHEIILEIGGPYRRCEYPTAPDTRVGRLMYLCPSYQFSDGRISPNPTFLRPFAAIEIIRVFWKHHYV